VAELLALAPKLHPPQLQDEQFQILDFGVPRDEFGVLLDDQHPQCAAFSVLSSGSVAGMLFRCHTALQDGKNPKQFLVFLLFPYTAI